MALDVCNGPNVYTYVRQNPWSLFDPDGLKIDDQTHRVKPKEVRDPGKRPERSDFGKGIAGQQAHKAAKEKWESAKKVADENAKFNRENAKIIEAWKNYDTAIELLSKTREGRILLDKMRGSDDVYTVFIGASYTSGGQTATIGGDVGGRRQYMGKFNGADQYVMMVTPSYMTQADAVNSDGSPNVNSDSYGFLWHEFYHNDDGAARGRSVYGTYSQNDEMLHENGVIGPHRLSHERRAVRFENIIRNRLGGGRVATHYGSPPRETNVPDPLGQKIE
jgi:hypothetical protein